MISTAFPIVGMHPDTSPANGETVRGRLRLGAPISL